MKEKTITEQKTPKKKRESITAEVLEIGFSPDGYVQNRIIKYIRKATENIRVIAFAFNNNAIAIELIKAHQKGRDVQILSDARQTLQIDSDIPKLEKAGVVWYPAFVNGKGCLHSKVIIIDNHITITGSFNFTNGANINAENIIILKSRKVAKRYLEHFQYILKHSKLKSKDN